MTLNEFKEWKSNPQTQEWFKYLEWLREESKEAWAESLYTGESGDETLQRNAAAIGQINLLRALIETTFEEMESKGE